MKMNQRSRGGVYEQGESGVTAGAGGRPRAMPFSWKTGAFLRSDLVGGVLADTPTHEAGALHLET